MVDMRTCIALVYDAYYELIYYSGLVATIVSRDNFAAYREYLI